MLVKNALEATPLCVRPDASLFEVLEQIRTSAQDTAAVVDAENRLVAVVGLYDILRLIIPAYLDTMEGLAGVMHHSYFEERFARLKGKLVQDAMQVPVDTTDSDDSLIKVAARMVEQRRNSLMVVKGERFVGIVTRRSLLARVMEYGA